MTAAGKARGIIFRGDEVRSAREGRKTQFRRVVKSTARGCTVGVYSDSDRGPYECVNVGDDGDPIDSEPIRCPYGVPGDRLWVRETFGVVRSLGADRDHDDYRYVYRADPADAYQWDGAASQGFRWRPSIFMPREASRLTLVVEAVRVERLSAITDEDAVAEGFVGHASANVDGAVLSVEPGEQYLAAFRAMHNLAADADPWLWVVTFKKEPANG